MQPGSPEALLAAIAGSGNEVTQGWMRVLEGAPASAASLPWANSSLQRDYFEKQARLWTALASGKRETLATPEPGDRRFADYFKFVTEGKAKVYIQRVFDNCTTTRGQDGPYNVDKLIAGDYGELGREGLDRDMPLEAARAIRQRHVDLCHSAATEETH